MAALDLGAEIERAAQAAVAQGASAPLDLEAEVEAAALAVGGGPVPEEGGGILDFFQGIDAKIAGRLQERRE